MPAASQRLVGYARVSTDDQDTVGQRQALKEAGCRIVYEDIGSGASRDRPELERCLETLRAGDVLIVTRLDRLARSVEHLYQVIRMLKERGVGFRSLREVFDTTTPSGKMMAGLLIMISEFERELINERSRLGIKAAKERGVRFGNPRFRDRDPVTISTMKATQGDTYLKRARRESAPWRHLVQTHRPTRPWPRVLDAIVRSGLGDGLTQGTLVRHVRRLVAAGDLPHEVLGRAKAAGNEDAATTARRIAAERPGVSLRAIGRELDALGIRPARASSWSAQTVKTLLQAPNGPYERDTEQEGEKTWPTG